MDMYDFEKQTGKNLTNYFAAIRYITFPDCVTFSGCMKYAWGSAKTMKARVVWGFSNGTQE